MRNGGIAEKFMCLLYENGYSGKYRIFAAASSPAAAETEQQLADAGLDREGMIRAIKDETET